MLCGVECRARDQQTLTNLLYLEYATRYLCVYVCVGARFNTLTLTMNMNKPLHPVTREADMEVPFLLKEMLS